MYWIVAEDGTETKRIKGVNKNLKKSNKEFEDVLFNKKVVRHKIKRIESKLHKIGTHEVSKISSSCFEDKRWISDDGISTLAYFHKETKCL